MRVVRIFIALGARLIAARPVFAHPRFAPGEFFTPTISLSTGPTRDLKNPTIRVPRCILEDNFDTVYAPLLRTILQGGRSRLRPEHSCDPFDSPDAVLSRVPAGQLELLDLLTAGSPRSA